MLLNERARRNARGSPPGRGSSRTRPRRELLNPPSSSGSEQIKMTSRVTRLSDPIRRGARLLANDRLVQLFYPRRRRGPVASRSRVQTANVGPPVASYGERKRLVHCPTDVSRTPRLEFRDLAAARPGGFIVFRQEHQCLVLLLCELPLIRDTNNASRCSRRQTEVESGRRKQTGPA